MFVWGFRSGSTALMNMHVCVLCACAAGKYMYTAHIAYVHLHTTNVYIFQSYLIVAFGIRRERVLLKVVFTFRCQSWALWRTVAYVILRLASIQISHCMVATVFCLSNTDRSILQFSFALTKQLRDTHTHTRSHSEVACTKLIGKSIVRLCLYMRYNTFKWRTHTHTCDGITYTHICIQSQWNALCALSG